MTRDKIMTTLTLGLAQTNAPDNNFDARLTETEQWYAEARERNCDLLAFPEIFLTRFFPQYPNRPDMAYPITLNGPEIQKLKDYSKKYRVAALPNVYLTLDHAGSVAHFDATVFIDESGEIQSISKMVHIADQHQFHELPYYTPAPDGFKVFPYKGFNIGIIICFDRHFPESFRLCAQQGADLIIIPTANTTGEPLDLFDAEIQVSAFQNSVAIAMVNRTGQEDQMNFAGRSCVVDARGTLLQQAGSDKTLLVQEIDLESIRDRQTQNCYLPALRCQTQFINQTEPLKNTRKQSQTTVTDATI